MDFRILGPLEVSDGGREVRLRGGKQRALLALVLVNANRTLAIDRIVDDLWGDDVPGRAEDGADPRLQAARGAGAGTLHTRPPGYALPLEPDELDLYRFERLVGDARASLAPAGPSRRLKAFARGWSCGAGRRSRSSRRSRSPRWRRRGSRSSGSPRWRDGSKPTSGSGATAPSSASSSH